jgi:hypothetical protein
MKELDVAFAHPGNLKVCLAVGAALQQGKGSLHLLVV